MEKDTKIVLREQLEERGPDGELLFHIVTTTDHKVFKHILGCPQLKRAFRIKRENKKRLNQKALKKGILALQKKLRRN